MSEPQPDLIESTARKMAESHWKDYVPDAEVAIRYLLVERVVQVQRDTIQPEAKEPFLFGGMTNATVSYSQVSDPTNFDVVEEFHRCDARIHPAVNFYCYVCKKVIPAAAHHHLEGAYRAGELTWRLRCHHQEYLHDIPRTTLEDIVPGTVFTVVAFQDETTVPVDQTAKPFEAAERVEAGIISEDDTGRHHVIEAIGFIVQLTSAREKTPADMQDRLFEAYRLVTQAALWPSHHSLDADNPQNSQGPVADMVKLAATVGTITWGYAEVALGHLKW